MPPQNIQVPEVDNSEQVELEMLRQIFDAIDSLDKKIDQLIEKDMGVHQMVEKEETNEIEKD